MGQDLNAIDFDDPDADFSDFGVRSRTRRDRIKNLISKNKHKTLYTPEGKARGKDSKPKNDWHDWD